MNKLDMVLYFVNDAKEKGSLLKEYIEDRRKYFNGEIKGVELYNKYPQKPTKQIVLDDIKMARRLLNEFAKRNRNLEINEIAILLL